MIRTIQWNDWRRAVELREEKEARARKRAKRWEGPATAVFVAVLAAFLLWLAEL